MDKVTIYRFPKKEKNAASVQARIVEIMFGYMDVAGGLSYHASAGEDRHETGCVPLDELYDTLHVIQF